MARELARDPESVAKWRKLATAEDQMTGPAEPRSTVMTLAEESIVVSFRRHALRFFVTAGQLSDSSAAAPHNESASLAAKG